MDTDKRTGENVFIHQIVGVKMIKKIPLFLIGLILSCLAVSSDLKAQDKSYKIEKNLLQIIEPINITIRVPEGYKIEESAEPNRRGSFLSFNLRPPVKGGMYETPYIYEVQLFSVESIKWFEEICSNRDKTEDSGEGFCETGTYPNINNYNDQKDFLKNHEMKGKYQTIKENQTEFIVFNTPCFGDSCIIREYRTFIADTMVAIWITMGNGSEVNKADQLFSQLIIN